MKIYLLDKSREMVSAWKKYFENEDVEIVCEDFMLFMELYDVECVVSPANAYGLMDGGFDLAISNYFGNELQKKVQKVILFLFCSASAPRHENPPPFRYNDDINQVGFKNYLVN